MNETLEAIKNLKKNGAKKELVEKVYNNWLDSRIQNAPNIIKKYQEEILKNYEMKNNKGEKINYEQIEKAYWETFSMMKIIILDAIKTIYQEEQ